MREKDPDLDMKKRIFDLISQSPGVHFREISRRLDAPTGALEYHLHQMEKRDMIVAKHEGKYKRYYAEGKVGSAEKRLLSYLRKDIPRGILIHLMLHPGARHRDIKEALSVGGPILSFHLRKMVRDGLVKEEDEGTKRLFVADPDAVSRSLIMYKRSFMDDLVDSFADTWLDM